MNYFILDISGEKSRAFEEEKKIYRLASPNFIPSHEYVMSGEGHSFVELYLNIGTSMEKEELQDFLEQNIGRFISVCLQSGNERTIREKRVSEEINQEAKRLGFKAKEMP